MWGFPGRVFLSAPRSGERTRPPVPNAVCRFPLRRFESEGNSLTLPVPSSRRPDTNTIDFATTGAVEDPSLRWWPEPPLEVHRCGEEEDDDDDDAEEGALSLPMPFVYGSCWCSINSISSCSFFVRGGSSPSSACFRRRCLSFFYFPSLPPGLALPRDFTSCEGRAMRLCGTEEVFDIMRGASTGSGGS